MTRLRCEPDIFQKQTFAAATSYTLHKVVKYVCVCVCVDASLLNETSLVQKRRLQSNETLKRMCKGK